MLLYCPAPCVPGLNRSANEVYSSPLSRTHNNTLPILYIMMYNSPPYPFNPYTHISSLLLPSLACSYSLTNTHCATREKKRECVCVGSVSAVLSQQHVDHRRVGWHFSVCVCFEQVGVKVTHFQSTGPNTVFGKLIWLTSVWNRQYVCMCNYVCVKDLNVWVCLRKMVGGKGKEKVIKRNGKQCVSLFLMFSVISQ